VFTDKTQHKNVSSWSFTITAVNQSMHQLWPTDSHKNKRGWVGVLACCCKISMFPVSSIE